MRDTRNIYINDVSQYRTRRNTSLAGGALVPRLQKSKCAAAETRPRGFREQHIRNRRLWFLTATLLPPSSSRESVNKALLLYILLDVHTLHGAETTNKMWGGRGVLCCAHPHRNARKCARRHLLHTARNPGIWGPGMWSYVRNSSRISTGEALVMLNLRFCCTCDT